ncbi:MAG: uL22 family ribosomal protein [Candidatus Micrarchaeota archaeon]
MKGYSSNIPENCTTARVEGVNASYKDLSQVCRSIRSKKSDWAVSFLEKAAEGEVAVRYKTNNKRLGHRRELGGKKGRYPKKAAKIVLKALLSAIANGKIKGLGDVYTVLIATANKKNRYPRIASKGRWARSFLETSRVELVLQGPEVPKGVEVTPPKKADKPKEKKAEAPKTEPKTKAVEPKKAEETPKTEEKNEAPKQSLKKEGATYSKHNDVEEPPLDTEKRRKEKPHQHGENSKR